MDGNPENTFSRPVIDSFNKEIHRLPVKHFAPAAGRRGMKNQKPRPFGRGFFRHEKGSAESGIKGGADLGEIFGAD